MGLLMRYVDIKSVANNVDVTMANAKIAKITLLAFVFMGFILHGKGEMWLLLNARQQRENRNFP
jgi:hypothetical protein